MTKTIEIFHGYIRCLDIYNDNEEQWCIFFKSTNWVLINNLPTDLDFD